MPLLDETVSALLEDLHVRGLLKSTLVVVVGEFGRTPKIESKNGMTGRDHWPSCFSAVVAGAVIRGSVYGASDKIGAFVKDRPVRPQDLGATVYHAAGGAAGFQSGVASDHHGRADPGGSFAKKPFQNRRAGGVSPLSNEKNRDCCDFLRGLTPPARRF